MNLFVNAVSKNAKLILFNDDKKIISDLDFEIKGNESSLLLPNIDKFLKNKDLSYFDIKNIVVVNGPGSFTGVRTIVLIVNTISYISNTFLTPLNYFDLFNKYPIVKSSSKRDCFFKKNKNSSIEIITNDALDTYLKDNSIKTIYGEGDIKNAQIIEKIDYSTIINKITFKNFKRIEALYIKKPNIC